MKKIEEAEIYPKNLKIYGWENPRSIENVLSILIALKRGHKIPNTALWTFNNGKDFYISPNNGGHHRWISLSILNPKVKTHIFYFKRKEMKDKCDGIKRDRRLVEKIDLENDPLLYLINEKRIKFPSMKEFFLKYWDINQLLGEFGKGYSFSKESYAALLEGIEMTKKELGKEGLEDWRNFKKYGPPVLRLF